MYTVLHGTVWCPSTLCGMVHSNQYSISLSNYRLLQGSLDWLDAYMLTPSESAHLVFTVQGVTSCKQRRLWTRDTDSLKVLHWTVHIATKHVRRDTLSLSTFPNFLSFGYSFIRMHLQPYSFLNLYPIR